MADFLSKLPAPTRTVLNRSKDAVDPALASYSLISKSIGDHLLPNTPLSTLGISPVKKVAASIPPYGKRKGWLPRCLEDFEDGGAYPELQVAQFPLNMDRGQSSEGASGVVVLQRGADGKLEYDAVIRQNLSHRLAIHTRPDALKPKWSSSQDLQKPSEEEQDEIEKRTKAAIDSILAKKLSKGIPKSVNQEPEYIKYTPNEQAPGHNANCAQRIIRMIEAQVDPMEPPKFKHKRVPRGGGSPPPAILHSPPRKLSAKDQAAWKIPPCISNWKNQKGYTIPLDKRLQASGRSLQDVSINDKFASLSEALYIAERAAREEVRIRNELVKQKKEQEEVVREQQLRELAAKARAERAAALQQREAESKDAIGVDSSTTVQDWRKGDERQQRLKIERQRRREIERDVRLERAGKKSKAARDEGRDISEKVALGQARPTAQESLFDSRLFNQSAGMDSGFNAGDDEKYNVYDKPLFVDRSRDGGIYRYDRERMEQNVGFLSSDLAAFPGADTSSRAPRTAPVEFEIDVNDPFGLESLIAATVNKKK